MNGKSGRFSMAHFERLLHKIAPRCWCCKLPRTDTECESSCEIIHETVRHGQRKRCLTHDSEAEAVASEAWPS